jgi:hypothetical protein
LLIVQFLLFAVAVVVDVEAAGVVVAGAAAAAGVAVAADAGVVVAGAVVVGVVVVGAVVTCSSAGVSLRFLRPPSPRLLSARCSCSAIAVSISAISSAVALLFRAFSSSACMACIWAFNASISGSAFLVQPVAAPMISIPAITGISILVMFDSFVEFPAHAGGCV